MVGPLVFGNPGAAEDPHSNRNLLIEACFAQRMLLANTFYEQPVEKCITYFDLAAKPYDEISYQNFAVLYYLLVQQE